MQLPDLNLLPALDALLRTGSVTGAAAELDVSPSAMSRTLGRLRRVLGDPLLVPAGRGLVPTALGRELGPRAEQALLGAADVLTRPAPPELSSLERVFVVRGSDESGVVLAPALAAAAAREAPRVRFRFVPEGDEDPADLRDRVDLEVGALPAAPPSDIRVRTVAAHLFAALVRPAAPVGDRLTLAEFVALPHVTVSRRGRAHSVVDERLADLGLRRDVLATVPAIGTAILLAGSADVLALVPSEAAAVVAGPAGLRTHPIPLDLPPVPTGMAWHRRWDADPAHRWLRATVAARLTAPPAGTVS